MKAATLFSGIGAPETAMPDWDWLWHAEIEKFPAAVMAERHPQSVNLGDVSAPDFYDRAVAIGRPDVLVFGSPCQSYSVAGQRLGLDDPRGNLALVALGLVQRLQPTWFVFENVPGLLSSWSGDAEQQSSDFDTFLQRVSDSGYQCAWAVLDAQFFGVAQRRKRVFVVGHADWRCAAAVLLISESLCGHPPARGEAGQDVTEGVAHSLRARSNSAHREDADTYIQTDLAPTLNAAFGSKLGLDNQHIDGGGAYSPSVSLCLNAGGMGRIDAQSETLITTGGGFDVAKTMPSSRRGVPSSDESASGYLVAHSLRADGFDASEDGIGRGTPLVPMVAPCLTGNYGKQPDSSDTSAGPMLVPVGLDSELNAVIDGCGPLKALSRSGGGVPGMVAQITYSLGSHSGTADGEVSNKSHASGGPSGMGISEEQAHTLKAGRTQAIAFSAKDYGVEAGDLSPTLRNGGHDQSHANGGVMPAIAFDARQSDVLTYGDKTGPLDTDGHSVGVGVGVGVRRLMPTECERLQGFPDDHTAITYRGKPAADGPRYKAIGNSMAVPVVRWILNRIEQVQALSNRRIA